jgi:hypothetical protein
MMAEITLRTFGELGAYLDQQVAVGIDLTHSRWYPNGTDWLTAENYPDDIFLDPPADIPGGRIGMGEEPSGQDKPSRAGGANRVFAPTLNDLRIEIAGLSAQRKSSRMFASGVELLSADGPPTAFYGEVAGSLRVSGGPR